ncbi:MAG: hypothetical protein QF619_12275 [Candidatus Binatia bacterium]|jgi:hypothetical protein|nr:hypothetical protein [Candidatus Binatia bacterium]
MSGAKSFPRLFTVDEANGFLSSLRPLVEGVFEIINILKKTALP